MFEGFDDSYVQNPCKDCENRSATCHGVCKAYLEWKKHNDALNKRARMNRIAERF